MGNSNNDLVNQVLDDWDEPNPKQKLPSNFQVGEQVSILFRPDFLVTKAVVTKVHFTASKVQYDLDVHIRIAESDSHPEGFTTTRIHNIDAAIVSPME